jgi:hypothetical protein
VTFDLFLSSVDAKRVCRVLEKLALRDLHGFALTGSLALETQWIGLGHPPHTRELNDLDIVVDSLASIPDDLARDFLVRHIHPKAPQGKMLIQLVDPEEALRIDVFRAYGATMMRSQPVCFGTSLIQVVSLEDLAARAASLVMDLGRSVPVARKHARDFQILAQVINVNCIEAAWQDHRKSTDPGTFKEALTQIGDLVKSHGDLLVVPDYSHDGDAACPKCEETPSFRLASPEAIMSILGYC